MTTQYHILITLVHLEATAIIARGRAEGWIDTIEYLKGLYRADISLADLLEYYPPEDKPIYIADYHEIVDGEFHVWYRRDNNHLIFAEKSAS